MNIDEQSLTRELNCWVALRLPARLDVQQTAKLLGFADHDIQILMATRLLVPLGKPAQNAPKYFSACATIALAADHEWLSKATVAVSRYWRNKRERCLLARATVAQSTGHGQSVES